MKTIKMTMIALLAVISLGSCKKDEEKTTAQKIQVKWNIDNVVDSEMITGQPVSSHTTKGVAGDYIDFRTDGKAYSKFEGKAEESGPYSIDNDKQITLDGIVYAIDQLNDKIFVLHSRKTFSSGSTESILTLTR